MDFDRQGAAVAGPPLLGVNQYGKAQVRIVAVDRSSPVHTFADLNVSITLSGALEDVHLTGSNANVVATDTQQNTVYAFARDGVGEIEEFGLRLARHFVAEFEPITRARVQIESSGWQRIPVDGAAHDHSFMMATSELRIAEAVVDQGDGDTGEWVLSGLKDLIVLKTTGSEFHGFIRDRYTVLAETDDRILSTSVNARWRHGALLAPGEWDASFTAARTAMLEQFTVHSLSLQQTLYAMGASVLRASPGVAEVRFSMPNRHHFAVDLERFGLDNPNLVFRVQDRPYGLIEGQVLAEDAPPAGPAWEPYPLL